MDENILLENDVQANTIIDIADTFDEPLLTENKSVTLLDTITTQAIICVVVGLVYLAVNTFLPHISTEIYDTYNSQVSVDNNTTGFSETITAILDFFNSTPNKSV